MSKHIEDFTLFLYAIGYKQLTKDTINYIQKHLEECPACSDKFSREVQNLATLLKESEEELTKALDLKPALNALARFLTVPKGLESLRWFEEAYNKIAIVLRERVAERFEDKAGKIPIVSRGLMSTESVEQEEYKQKRKKLDFSAEEKRMTRDISALFQILADDSMDILERAKLAKKLHNVAKEERKKYREKKKPRN